MSYQIPNRNKINDVLQLSESQISSLANNDVLGIDLTSLNPVMKAGTLNDFMPNPLIATEIHTNTIRSIGANDNLIIDAQGTGEVQILTVTNGGFKVTSTVDSSWAARFTNATSQTAVVLGSYLQGGQNRPSIAGHLQDMSDWYPLWIQWDNLAVNSNSYVVMGDIPVAIAAGTGSKLYVQGDVGTTTNLKLRDDGTNRHTISGNSPGGTRTHTLPNKNGTIQHLNQAFQAFGIDATTNIVGLAAFTNLGCFAWRGADKYDLGPTDLIHLNIVVHADAVGTVEFKLRNESGAVDITGTITVNTINGYSYHVVPIQFNDFPVLSAVLGIQGKVGAGPTNVVLRQVAFAYGNDSL